MARPNGARVLLGRASDKFGDHGIVVAAVATLEGGTARIESLLMSCRVMSRRIETAFLDALIGDLIAHGAGLIEASYLPTLKNGMVRDLYAAHGFTIVEGPGDGLHFQWREGESKRPGSPFVTVQWRTA